MLWPSTPSSVSTSVSTSGDSATVPLAVWWGCIGTRTARTRTPVIFGIFPPPGKPSFRVSLPVAVDLAALHHEGHVPYGRDVTQRIARDPDQVRLHALRD